MTFYQKLLNSMAYSTGTGLKNYSDTELLSELKKRGYTEMNIEYNIDDKKYSLEALGLTKYIN